MDFSLKAFKSHGSYKYVRKLSGTDSTQDQEQLPILSDQEPNNLHQKRSFMAVSDASDRKEVIVKVDEADASSNASARAVESVNSSGRIWRESSYDFWNDSDSKRNNGEGSNGDGGKGEDFEFRQQRKDVEDPPSKLIGQFLHKQKASGEMCLDMDMEMLELPHDKTLPTVAESPMRRSSKELKVSFESISEISESDSLRRRHRDSPVDEEHRVQQPPQRDHRPHGNGHDDGAAEVVRCTSNSSFERNVSFQRKSSLLKTKTKSRLLDPPEHQDRRSGRVPKSGQIRSGLLSKALDEEDDDPFLEEDLPDEYKKANLGVLTMLQWASLILIIAALICTLTIRYWRRKKLWKLELWKWEVMILVLICGRLFSGWGIRIIVFFIERSFLLRKRVLYFVYGVRKAVQNCLWLGLVLIAWNFLFDDKVQREVKSDALEYVTKVLICLLVSTLVWLVKTLIVKVLASSFHVSTYFDRIQDALYNQYVIETLSGPPLIEIQKSKEEEEKLAEEVMKLQNAGATIPPDLRASAFSSPEGGRVIGSGGLQKSPRGRSAKLSRALSKKGDEGITIDHLHRLSPKNVSAWNMKRLMNIVRHGALSTLDEQIKDSAHEDESTTQIKSEYEAKVAAKRIFQNVASQGSKYIYLEDLMRFMVEDEASKTMSLFEGASESRKISKSSLKNWVVNAFRERRALALTLNDTKTAVNKLHRMVNILVSVIILVIWLLILGIATSKFLLFVTSQLVLVAFVFGNTCKTVFEAIIFLFVMHPFDVGDRCEIDGVQMIVEEMNILTTVFLRFDNQKIIFPNSVLATKAIHNYYRSPDMGDAVEFCLHISTPPEKIAIMRQRILGFIEGKKEHWCPAPLIILKDVEELNRMRIAIWLTHRMNHQDMGERWTRRAFLVEELVKIFQELDLQYRLLPLNINVCSLPPVNSTRLPATWGATAS
ncbi:mechanosensitive ion channel protein 6-like isoform X2 [Cucurbita pepo subsp. pepo]|uniref:mechanosensitive ion channel protein 6-like isoform X1 n=1 Tax=Cucurbita pepo subsp. pepo TaxID=3664 RepID=UPI000C9D4466|nr:mechanosensitive ion channel protein 6-like isoform X1 [Cucurbita pepo subsp. pepo]XP_023512519.1 mechanosensitive ion channel protein 6-like isoform X2 [Cucurbita pepo subsp. pepo]